MNKRLVHSHLNWLRNFLFMFAICMFVFSWDIRRWLQGYFWLVLRWLKKASKFVAPSLTNGNVITTPLMVQSISDPITSFLTFEEPSPHICGAV